MSNRRQDFDPSLQPVAPAGGSRIETLERELAQCQQRLRCLVEHSPVLTLEIDPQGRIAAASPELRRRLGYASEQLIGQPLCLLLPDWDRPELLAELAATRVAHDVVARHGEGMRCELAATVVCWSAEGCTGGYLLLARDMTAQRRGLRQLRVQAEVIERTRDAVVVLDEGGHVLGWNRSAERLYGHPARSMKGQPFDQVFDGVERARLQAAIDRTDFGAEAPTELELSRRNAQGGSVRLGLRLWRIGGTERGRELLLVFGVETGVRHTPQRSAVAHGGAARIDP